MSKLTDRRCVALPEGSPALSATAAKRLLALLHRDWRLIEGAGSSPTKLERQYTCGDFAEAMDFARQAGQIAESEQHHPDLLVRWGALIVTLWTHTVQGLSENDFILAAKLDAVLDTARTARRP